MLRGLLAILALLAVLAGFHFWGEKQRARQWWWIGGDQSAMLFLDLLHEKEGEGHVLSAEKAGGEEFDVEWKCSPRSIRWGEKWTRDEDFQQLERSPAPDDMATWHAPQGYLETRVLEVACASADQRLGLRSVLTKRPPIEATRDAIEAVGRGVEPKRALFDALEVAPPAGS